MRYFLLLSMLALSSIPSLATQYQATAATLSGGAFISGDYVQMKDGDMSFNAVSVSSAGMYDIVIRYKQDYDSMKKQKLVVNGDEIGEIGFPRSQDWRNITAVANLSTVNNTIAIKNSWGWVDIMYIDVVPHENAPFNLGKNLSNSNSNMAAKKIFAFMQENFQKKIISGVMTGDVLSGNSAVALDNQGEVSHIRASSGNKTPAAVGFDFMHGTGKEFEDANGGWFKSYTDATISLAKELYQRGGIPEFCWHWRDPLKNEKGFYSENGSGDKTTFDLTRACANGCAVWNKNSAEYKAIIEDIDKIAGYLKELQDAGVAVLWRPVHEASGGWFWWGSYGADAYKLLYKLIYDRLKEKGLNNLIWVWTSEGADIDWYPGDDYVDIIGRDFYYNPQSTINHASLIAEFEELKNNFGNKKMIALSENGSVPYPENLINDGAGWSYFMPWYGDFVTQSNTAAAWQKIMNDDYVITLEDMPGWGSYEIPSSINALKHSSINIKTLDFSAAKIYDMRGKRVHAGSYAELKSGVYIASINGAKVKFSVSR